MFSVKGTWTQCAEEYVETSCISDQSIRKFKLVKPLHIQALLKGSTGFSYCYDCLQILSVDLEE